MNPEDTQKSNTPETQSAPAKEAPKTEVPAHKPETLEFLRQRFAEKVAPAVAKEEKPKTEKPEKKETPKKPEEKPAAEEKPKAEKPADKETPKEEKKEPVRKVAKDPVRIEGADSLAEAAKSLEKILEKQAKKDEPKVVERELPEEIAELVPDLEELEQLDPKKFKGIKAKVAEFKGKGGIEDQYKAQWRKENPGKEFDEDDEEHAQFYEEHEPKVTDADLKKAERARIKRELRAELNKEIEPVKEEVKSERAKQLAAPATAKYIDETVIGLAKAVSPTLSSVEPKDWQTADPLAHKLLVKTASRYAPMIKATAELEAGVAYNDKDDGHRAVKAKLESLESKLKRLPAQQTAVPVEHNGEVVGYRTFATLEEYAKASEEKKASLWTVDASILVAQIGQEWQRVVKEEYDDITSTTGYKPAGVQKSGQQVAKSALQKSDEVPDTQEEDSSSPSISASSKTPTPSEAEGNPSGNTIAVLKKVFGRG